MNKYLTLALSLSSLALFSGCVQTKPLVSHAHIGHALTTWHDTPGQDGLFEVAGKELDIALQSTEQAAALVQPGYHVAGESDGPARAQRQVLHALNALNPDRYPVGRGLGYGAVRALSGAIEHLEYAANSDDASENFISSVVELVDDGDAVIERMQAAERILGDADVYGPDAASALTHAHALLAAAKFGSDAPETFGASNLSGAGGEAGLLQIESELDAMLARESDPGYQPLPRRYVLGLVRLPNGLWDFRLPRRDRPVGSYGYGY